MARCFAIVYVERMRLSVKGKSLPPKAPLNHVLESFRLPKDVSPGKLAKWGPVAQEATLGKSHIAVWSPVTFSDSDDVPDFTGDEITPMGYSGEIGYTSFTVVYVEVPQSLAEQYDEDGLDKLISSKYGVNDDGGKVKFGTFTTYTSNKVNFRTVTYDDDSVQGRVDVAIQDGKLYLFAVSVPKGMLNSEDVKHFFSSIVIK